MQLYVYLSTVNEKTVKEKRVNISVIVRVRLYKLAHKKRVLITWATSKGSGEPAHKRRLARAFAVRRHILEIQRKLQQTILVRCPNRDCACATEEPQTENHTVLCFVCRLICAFLSSNKRNRVKFYTQKYVH